MFVNRSRPINRCTKLHSASGPNAREHFEISSLANLMCCKEEMSGTDLIYDLTHSFIRQKSIISESIYTYTNNILTIIFRSKFKATRVCRIQLMRLLFFILAISQYANLELVCGHSTSLNNYQNESHQQASSAIYSDENFTFTQNGSFLQLDAGREWPFNSKREITFRFKTKSSHGLLIYQTFDHSKLVREEEQDTADQLMPIPLNAPLLTPNKQSVDLPAPMLLHQAKVDILRKRALNHEVVKKISRENHDILSNADSSINQLSSNTITATASEILVNSLFSSSPSAAINGNNPSSRIPLAMQMNSRDKSILASVSGASKESGISRNHRVLNTLVKDSDSPKNRVSYAGRAGVENNDGSTVLSSSAISSFSASMYELYLKLENGRLKIMYEFGSRLNQTYCGKGLNDDRWHKVDLKVDPELNQMILVLDQMITVEIVLSQQLADDEYMRRNELVFTNSVLYLGGLDKNTSIVKNVKQRLYLAQFIGCIGQILLKTDQHTESLLQPVPIDRLVMIKRGCINKCDTDNYCLHKSICVNYYTHTKCDCFGTNYEDVYCWQDQLTTLSMLGYSTLTYRIYDWRDRHHSNINRLSIQFRTLALDSILFFGYGDLTTQQSLRNLVTTVQSPSSTMIQTQTSFVLPQVNISNVNSIHRPMNQQASSNSNYLAVSLSNGTIVVEVNFGDQPILLSNLLYDKVYNRMTQTGPIENNPTSNYYRPLNLSDGRWHNVTFIHNNKQIYLFVDNYSTNYTIMGKNSHLYFDPTIYFGGVPNLLLNETRSLAKPFNLRQKFVGCMRSVYFNQNNILLALKQESPMIEYRDSLGKPRLDSCLVREPSSLPLTIRSGKSYLTFQLTQNAPVLKSEVSLGTLTDHMRNDHIGLESKNNITTPLRKLTKIEFEYRTPSKSYFLAGGHLRDLSYHDLGGFWTLHARENCQLYFTISSGLTFEPEQIIKIESSNNTCNPNAWNRIAISMISGDKILNVTQTNCITVSRFEDEYSSVGTDGWNEDYQSYVLKSSVELLHQVQLGGDLAKFGESSSVPFNGCFRRIKINGHLFDSRDFVTNSAIMSPLAANINQQNSSLKVAQSDVISSRMAQGYVALDSCQLVEPCTILNPCKNNGTCKVNELGEPECDCSKTGYTGKRCHFSIYKQSCQDLFLGGQRKSAQYLIDLDRNGPMKPLRVRCNMDDGSGHIETVLAHNLPTEFLVRSSPYRDIQLDITYLAFNHMFTSDGFYVHDDNDETLRKNQDLVLRNLIGQSLYCRQYFRYECRYAPLRLGNKTWMEAPYPKNHKLTSLDGVNRGKCSCATTEKKCLNPSKNCNCDSGESFWTDDSYELIGHEDVGLTQIVILKDDESKDQQSSKNTESQSRFTLSDLKCYGTKQHESHHEITFKTSDAYIEVPGWRRGDISFSFRTASNPPAIILYQLATSRNHGYFRLTLITDTRVLFEFIINRKPRKLFLTSAHKLNNGEWQQVFIEYDPVNLRLTINDDSIMVDLEINDHLGTFEGPLFIGGAPSKYLVNDSLKRNGFTGCFRGLTVDGNPINLKTYLSPSMPSVTSSCKPSCSKNLCQNGGKCIEYWGSYECECSNPIAHSGSNCEINLNTNSITFVTQESYYVQVSNDSLSYPSYLIKNILLNIRTYQETALILYASDHLNNFIQLHKNGSSLVFTFNSNSTIIMAQVPINDDSSADTSIPNHMTTLVPTSLETSIIPIATNLSHNSRSLTNFGHLQSLKHANTSFLNHTLIDRSIRVGNTSGSGQPIQVKIERHRLRTTFYVNNNFMVVEEPLQFLTNYTQNPWSNPEMELVRPPRPKMGSKTYFQVFLANIDEYFSTRLPGFTGCIQGLSIDNQLFDFNRAHLTGELKGDYRIGCKMQCDSFPCKNQGTCIENWHENKIQCKCDTTSYVGRLCDEDIAAIFNGRTSYFLYHLSKKFNQPNTNHQLGKLTDSYSQNQTITTEASTYAFSSHKLVDLGQTINYLEISFAFSVDVNQHLEMHSTCVQVLLLITRANSSKHFFLGLTPDGSLLIQEDYGNSMSLSRLIKRPDQPYNDGYRHIVKYLRYNQTIQIIVDYQTYLPTMSVITVNQLNKYSKSSIILIGAAGDKSGDANIFDGISLDGNYTNYSGCISNLVIKMDDILIEPLSEAFGQNLETVNINMTQMQPSLTSKTIETEKSSMSAALYLSTESTTSIDENVSKLSASDGQILKSKTLSVINRLSGKEVLEDMETIVARDVEQGRCSSFRKIEAINEKRSINEPKHTPLLEPRPIYMDPPKIKLYTRREVRTKGKRWLSYFDIKFYAALTLVSAVSSLALIYVYILQMRYKSEKFRCDTPFFHKRDELE